MFRYRYKNSGYDCKTTKIDDPNYDKFHHTKDDWDIVIQAGPDIK